VKRRIVLLGPPASGKGSQAQMVSQKYQIPAVSTGHLLRDEALANSELGKQAASYTSKGQLAPDQLVMAVLKKWLGSGRNSYIFDGFPRTLAQALQLKPLLDSAQIPLDIVLFLECDFATIESRVLGRVSCFDCKKVFRVGLHVESAESPCPECGGRLIRRADDQPAVLQHRMVQYFDKTAPLVDYYRAEGILNVIDGSQALDNVFVQIEEALRR